MLEKNIFCSIKYIDNNYIKTKEEEIMAENGADNNVNGVFGGVNYGGNQEGTENTIFTKVDASSLPIKPSILIPRNRFNSSNKSRTYTISTKSRR